MLNRHILFFLLLLAATLGPVLYFQTGNRSGWLDQLDQTPSKSVPTHLAKFSLSPDKLDSPISLPVAVRNVNNDFNPSQSSSIPNSPPAIPISDSNILPGDAHGPNVNAIPLEFLPVTNLGDIFRFDINPSWVKQRWDRTSITTGEPGLSGMRVSLVTGVNSDDLFGSLTYFFDARQTVQKISFQGWAGNPDKLIHFMTSAYGFKNRPTSAAGLYVAQKRERSTGVLYMQHASVIRSSNPTQQVAIMLEVNNPHGPYNLSQEIATAVFNTRR